ncbi:hypothetical protein JCM13664_11190 [Methylothermus subterraneus]
MRWISGLGGLLWLLPLWAEEVVWERYGELAVYPEQRATAYVQALDKTRLAAEVSGKVEKVEVREGDRVEAGQILVQLEETPLRLALERAQAALAAAQTNLEEAQRRYAQAQRLREKGLIAREDADAAHDRLALRARELEIQQADLKEAAWRFEHRYVRAPFAGFVVSRSVSPGDWVNLGQSLIQLMAEAREAVAFVPAELLPQLKSADRLDLQTTDGRRYALSFLQHVPQRELKSQEVKVRLRFQGEAPEAGTAGSLIWRDLRPHLPATALASFRGTLGVWVKKADALPCFLPLPQAQLGRTLPLALDLDDLIAARGHAELAWSVGEDRPAPWCTQERR